MKHDEMEKGKLPFQKKINICDIRLEREKGKQVLYIKVEKELEALFATKNVAVSENYKTIDGQGLEYYGLTTQVQEIANKFNNPSINRNVRIMLSNYGTSLYADGGINFSILRTKGISDGIAVIVDNLVLDTEFKQWVQDFGLFIKHLYMNFINKSSIKVTLSLEI